MSTSAYLLSCIRRGDSSDNTAAAALDALREDDARTLLDAVCQVADARTAAVAQQHLDTAARAIAPGAPLRGAILAEVLAEVGALPHDGCTLYLVEGSKAPQWTRPHSHRALLLSGSAVIVGSDWILQTAEKLQAARDARRITHTRRAPRRKGGGR